VLAHPVNSYGASEGRQPLGKSPSQPAPRPRHQRRFAFQVSIHKRFIVLEKEF